MRFAEYHLVREIEKTANYVSPHLEGADVDPVLFVCYFLSKPEAMREELIDLIGEAAGPALMGGNQYGGEDRRPLSSRLGSMMRHGRDWAMSTFNDRAAARLTARRQAGFTNMSNRKQDRELSNHIQQYSSKYGRPYTVGADGRPTANFSSWPKDDPVTKLAQQQFEKGSWGQHAGRRGFDIRGHDWDFTDPEEAARTADTSYKQAPPTTTPPPAAPLRPAAPPDTTGSGAAAEPRARTRVPAAPPWFATYQQQTDKQFQDYGQQLSQLRNMVGQNAKPRPTTIPTPGLVARKRR